MLKKKNKQTSIRISIFIYKKKMSKEKRNLQDLMQPMPTTAAQWSDLRTWWVRRCVCADVFSDRSDWNSLDGTRVYTNG